MHKVQMHRDTKSHILCIVFFLYYHWVFCFLGLFANSTVDPEHAKMLPCTFQKVRWIARTVLNLTHTTLSHPLSGDQTPGNPDLLHSTVLLNKTPSLMTSLLTSDHARVSDDGFLACFVSSCF